MPVAELLSNLIELQTVDKELFDLRRQLNEMPDRIKMLDRELEEVASRVKLKEEEVKRLQLDRKDKEMDLAEKENTIKKYQMQLYQIKTNNEYAALEKEIGGLKADNSLLEEEILLLFDEIESAEKAVNKEKERFDEAKKRIDAEKNNIETEKQEIKKKLLELEEKRNVIIPLIDKDTLSRYERILHNKDGLALVPVKGENCGGCFVNLPPQMINEIRSKEKMIYCERCARMLYCED